MGDLILAFRRANFIRIRRRERDIYGQLFYAHWTDCSEASRPCQRHCKVGVQIRCYYSLLVLKSPHACANLNFLMSEKAQNLLREIPSVDRILNHVRCETLLTRYNREYVTRKCREIVDALRAELRDGKGRTSELKEEVIHARVENVILAASVLCLDSVVKLS